MSEEQKNIPVEEMAAPTEPEETPAEMTDETPVVAEAVEPSAEAAVAAEPVAEAVESSAEAAVAAEPVAEVVEPSAEAAVAAEPVAEEPAAVAVEAAPSSAASVRSIDALSVGMEVTGRVKHIALFGAFLDIGVGQDALLHISQLGREVRNVEDVVKVGQTLNVYVLKVDKEQGRIALSLTKPAAMSWDTLRQGMEISGTVVKIENYGVFVDFGAERPGMIHVSELASGYVRSPADVVALGETITARVIKLDRRKKRIDLSMKAMQEKVETIEPEEEPGAPLPTAMELAMRRAMQDDDKAARRRAAQDKYERRERREREMEDIISRTLRQHHK